MVAPDARIPRSTLGSTLPSILQVGLCTNNEELLHA
jgi:hypothetical protein